MSTSYTSQQELCGPKSPQQSPTSTLSAPSIEHILTMARLAASFVENFPFAKGVCDLTIAILEQISIMQSNKESLRVLAEHILDVLNVISRELQAHEGRIDPHFDETCQIFTKALDSVQDRLLTQSEVSGGCLSPLRRFIRAQTFAEKVVECTAIVERHKDMFTLATTVETRLQVSSVRQNLTEIHETTKSTNETLANMSHKLVQGIDSGHTEIRELGKTLQQHQEKRSPKWNLQVVDHSRGHKIYQSGGSMEVTHGAKIRRHRSTARHSTRSPIKDKDKKPY